MFGDADRKWDAVRHMVLALGVVMFLTKARGIPSEQSNAGSTESRNKAIVEASFSAWSSGTGSPFDLLAGDATWTIVGRSVAGKADETRGAFMREVIRPFSARVRTPLTPVIRHIYTDGGTVSVFFEAKGMAPDGRPYVITYALLLDMRDGKVVAASAFLTASSSTSYGHV